MSRLTVYERLRQSRIARGEDLASLAERAGVRETLLRAIEEGRFADLPRGIYGRSAIRSFASALGLDAVEVLAECEPLLPAVDDPIGALARLRGIRPAARPAASATAEPLHAVHCSDSAAMWKPLPAAAIDAGIIMALLLLLVAATMTFTGAPLSAFRATSAPAFGLMGILLAGCYFACFAGVSGATLGERAIGIAPAPAELASHDLPSVAARTVRAALADVSCIRALGDSLGRAATEWHARMHSPTPTA